MTGYYTMQGALAAIDEAVDCIWKLIECYAGSFSEEDRKTMESINDSLNEFYRTLDDMEVLE